MLLRGRRGLPVGAQSVVWYSQYTTNVSVLALVSRWTELMAEEGDGPPAMSVAA